MNRHLFDRVAEKVLRDSLRVTKGENVTIETWNTGLPFAERVWVKARESGTNPVLLFEDEDSFLEALRHEVKQKGSWMGEHEYALLSKTDAYVFIPGPVLAGSSRLTRDELAAATNYNPSWYAAARKAKLRGVRMTFGYVGPEMAEALGKPIDEVVEHQLRGALVDLRKIRANARKVSRALKPGSSAMLRAEGEALRFRLGKESGLDGGEVSREKLTTGENMVNIPPGYFAREIATGTMSGAVRLHAPVPRLRTVVDLRLEFERGSLTSWECPQSQEWLNDLVKQTPEERRGFGAVVIGLNPELRRGCGQDRLTEGAVSFFGVIQSTARSASLDLGGKTLVADDALVTARHKGQYARS
jgi:leucyl aminopeptidase (aminopeptidase T)